MKIDEIKAKIENLQSEQKEIEFTIFGDVYGKPKRLRLFKFITDMGDKDL